MKCGQCCLQPSATPLRPRRAGGALGAGPGQPYMGQLYWCHPSTCAGVSLPAVPSVSLPAIADMQR